MPKKTMRVLGQAPTSISLRPSGPEYDPTGIFKSAQRRRGSVQAVSRYPIGNVPSGSSLQNYKSSRQLTPLQTYDLYVKTPDIRAAIDAIVRRVATWDWNIEPSADPSSQEYAAQADVADKLRNFLDVPNDNRQTWQEMMTQMVTDLLIYDAGVLELVGSYDAILDEPYEIKELVPWLGSEFSPYIDEDGYTVGYRKETEQIIGTSFPILGPERGDDDAVVAQFTPYQLTFFKLFANSRSPVGIPIMETIINEAITLLLSSEMAMMTMDADEIPPGLLVLGGLGGMAADRAKADLQSMRGKDYKIRVIASPNPNSVDAKWVELRKTPKELTMLEVVEAMRRMIWRVFGVMPVEMGATDQMPRATAMVQMDVSSSHLITPILELIQAKFNSEIIPRIIPEEFKGQIRFSFDRSKTHTPDDQLRVANRHDIYMRRGVLTINEVRAELGMMPIVGGDVPRTDTPGYGPVPVADLSEFLDALSGSSMDDDSDEVDESVDDNAEEDESDAPPKSIGSDGIEDIVSPVGEFETYAKYDEIDFSVPKSVKNELEKGLKWHEEGHSGDGLKSETVSWARRMANGSDISPDKAKKMNAWLARHESDKSGKGFKPGEDGFPSPGRVAWALWGGDPAVGWSAKLVRQMEREDQQRKLSDLSQKVQKALKKKAEDFNQKMKDGGFASWKRTTARTLAVVFKRGVGAYETNPQSVRPSVSSADQWAFARVNSYLYALEKEKFRSGKHDTDLLPKQHPMSTKK